MKPPVRKQFLDILHGMICALRKRDARLDSMDQKLEIMLGNQKEILAKLGPAIDNQKAFETRTSTRLRQLETESH